MNANPWLIANGKKRLSKLRTPDLKQLLFVLKHNLEREHRRPSTYRRVPEYLDAFRKALLRVEKEIEDREAPAGEGKETSQ